MKKILLTSLYVLSASSSFAKPVSPGDFSGNKEEALIKYTTHYRDEYDDLNALGGFFGDFDLNALDFDLNALDFDLNALGGFFGDFAEGANKTLRGANKALKKLGELKLSSPTTTYQKDRSGWRAFDEQGEERPLNSKDISFLKKHDDEHHSAELKSARKIKENMSKKIPLLENERKKLEKRKKYLEKSLLEAEKYEHEIKKISNSSEKNNKNIDEKNGSSSGNYKFIVGRSPLSISTIYLKPSPEDYKFVNNTLADFGNFINSVRTDFFGVRSDRFGASDHFHGIHDASDHFSNAFDHVLLNDLYYGIFSKNGTKHAYVIDRAGKCYKIMVNLKKNTKPGSAIQAYFSDSTHLFDSKLRKLITDPEIINSMTQLILNNHQHQQLQQYLRKEIRDIDAKLSKVNVKIADKKEGILGVEKDISKIPLSHYNRLIQVYKPKK